jgi:hypothetical protein
MAEFGLNQMCLGNIYALIVADRCLRKVYENKPCVRLIQYVIKRIDLFYRQYQNPANVSTEDWWFVTKWEQLLKEETHVGE